jgi:hypothetical protein
MWEPQPLTTLRASKACRGENFTFYLYLWISGPRTSCGRNDENYRPTPRHVCPLHSPGPTLLPFWWVAGLRRPESDPAYSPPSSSELTNSWSCTATDPYVFMACCLTKRRDGFTNLASLLLFVGGYSTTLLESKLCSVMIKWLMTVELLVRWELAGVTEVLGESLAQYI